MSDLVYFLLYSLSTTSLSYIFSGCDAHTLHFLARHSRSYRRGKPGEISPFGPSHATMSCQPFQLTDFGPQSSDTSDSDESVDSNAMELSTDRHVATLAESKLSEDCDVCHLASMQCSRLAPPDHPWEYYSRIRSSALAGRRCCSLIVDAIETWLRHADHRAHSDVHLGSGLLFNTLQVVLEFMGTSPSWRNGRYILNALFNLR